MTFQIPEGVHAREVDDELVILDSAGDRYFSLNPSGVVIWRRLSTGGTAEEAAADLVAEYGISAQAAQADVGELVLRLTQAGLARAAEGA